MEQIYDVAVIGAGPSGIAAAVYASKHGAKTVLLEKESMIGGTAFRADVHTLKGASYSSMDGLLNGITTKAWGSAIFHPETLVDRYYELLNKHSVTLLSRHEVISIEKKQHSISSIICATSTGKSVISAKLYIDASGTLEVETLTGESDSGVSQYCYITGLIGKVETVGGKCYSVEAKRLLKEKIQHSIDKGELSRDLYIEIQPTVRADIAFISVRYDYNNAIDGSFMRNKMNEAVKFMQEFGYGFENASLISSSKEIFRSATGSFGAKHTLALDEIVQGKYFSDQVAKLPYGEKEFYIPFGSLLSERFDNLVLCGKNIGATTNAISKINSIPTHFETGKAAGVACAIAIANDLSIANVSTYEINTKAKFENIAEPYIPEPLPYENDNVQQETSFIKPEETEIIPDYALQENKEEKQDYGDSFDDLDKFLSLLDDSVTPPTQSEEKIEKFENDLDLVMNIDSASIIKKEEPEDDLIALMEKVGEFADIRDNSDLRHDKEEPEQSNQDDLLLELFEDLYNEKPEDDETSSDYFASDDKTDAKPQQIPFVVDEDEFFYKKDESESDSSSDEMSYSGEEATEDNSFIETNDFHEQDQLASQNVQENSDSDVLEEEKLEAEEDQSVDEPNYIDANDFMSAQLSDVYAEKNDKEPSKEHTPEEETTRDEDISETSDEDDNDELYNEMLIPDYDEYKASKDEDNEEDEDPEDDAFLSHDDIFVDDSSNIITNDDVISMLYSDSIKAAEEEKKSARNQSQGQSKFKKQDSSSSSKNGSAGNQRTPRSKKNKDDKISSMLDMIYDITEQEDGVDQLDVIKNKNLSKTNGKDDNIKNYDKFKAIKDFLYNGEES